MRRMSGVPVSWPGGNAVFAILAALVTVAALLAIVTGKVGIEDPSAYLKHAHVLYQGYTAPDTPFDYAAYRPPLFATVIAMIETVAGRYQIHAALFCNILVAMLAFRLVIASTATVGLDKTGRLALTILLFANVWFLREATFLRETAWYALFCVLFVLACQRLKASPFLGAALGLVTGLAMLTRPSGIILMVAGAMVIAAFWGMKVIPARRFGIGMASFLAVAVLTVAPWHHYLYRDFGRFELTGSCVGGLNLFQGNMPIMGSLEPVVDIDTAADFLQDYIDGRVDGHRDPAAMGLCERDDVLKGDFLAYIEQHPARFVKSAAESFVFFFAPFPLPLGSGVAHFNEGAQQLGLDDFKMRKVSAILASYYYAVLLAAAFAGFLLMARRRDQLLWAGPAILLVLGHAALHAATFPETRYRMPLELLLCVPAALAIQRIAARRAEPGEPVS